MAWHVERGAPVAGGRARATRVSGRGTAEARRPTATASATSVATKGGTSCLAGLHQELKFYVPERSGARKRAMLSGRWANVDALSVRAWIRGEPPRSVNQSGPGVIWWSSVYTHVKARSKKMRAKSMLISQPPSRDAQSMPSLSARKTQSIMNPRVQY